MLKNSRGFITVVVLLMTNSFGRLASSSVCPADFVVASVAYSCIVQFGITEENESVATTKFAEDTDDDANINPSGHIVAD
jgi:hypothetical protein